MLVRPPNSELSLALLLLINCITAHKGFLYSSSATKRYSCACKEKKSVWPADYLIYGRRTDEAKKQKSSVPVCFSRSKAEDKATRLCAAAAEESVDGVGFASKAIEICVHRAMVANLMSYES